MKSKQKKPDVKPSNPKDIIGTAKLPLDVVPDSLEVFACLAFAEGALKYGRFNWRIAGVRSSIYMAALKRHLKKLQAGEWADPKTGVPHFASMIACSAIPLDAWLCGKLEDDRPPTQERLVKLIDGEATRIWNRLQILFKDHNPTQYTIAHSREARRRLTSVAEQIVRIRTTKRSTRKGAARGTRR